MSRKARTRSLSKSLNEGMSPSILSASVSYAFSEGNMDDVEDGGPLMILQKIQAAMVASVVSEKGVADKNKD